MKILNLSNQVENVSTKPLIYKFHTDLFLRMRKKPCKKRGNGTQPLRNC